MSSIRFKKLGMSNFMSFGQKPIYVDLDTKNLRVILGENADIGEEGRSANGVGKTTIFNAILFCLFGSGIDKLKADEYINLKNGKKLVVEIWFEANGKEYYVKRSRKPNSLEFLVDGVTQTLDAMKNTDEAITQALGFGHDIAMVSFFLSPHRPSFMSMSGPDQRSLIESMLSLDVLASRAEAVKKIRAEMQVDLRILERDVSLFQTQLESIDQNLLRLETKKDEFEKRREGKEHELLALKSELDEIDFDEIEKLLTEKEELTESLTLVREERTTLKEILARRVSELKDFDALMVALEAARSRRDNYETEQRKKIREIEADIKKLPSKEDCETFIENEETKELARSTLAKVRELTRKLKENEAIVAKTAEHIASHENGTCPVCNGPYTDEKALASLAEKQKKVEFEIISAREKLSEMDTEEDLVALLEECEEVKIDIPSVRSAEAALDRRKSLEKSLATEQSALAVNPYEQEFSELEDKLPVETNRQYIEIEISGFETDLVVNENTHTTLKEKLTEISERMEDIGLTLRSDVALAKSQLATIETDLLSNAEQVNPYVEEIEQAELSKPDITVAMDRLAQKKKEDVHAGYLVNLLTNSKSFVRRRILDNYVPYLNKKINEYAAGLGLPHVCEVKSDLSVDLIYMNKSVSYYNLSRGERLRLDMATTVAFRDVMSLLGKGCNISMLDEVLDSALDASGKQSALRLICKTAETVLLVTHDENLASGVDSKILVRKDNGFSHIVE